jgi:hypothetical protein
VTAEDPSLRFTLAQRLVLAVVPRLVWALFSLIGRTWRFEVIAEEGVTPILFRSRNPRTGDLLFLAPVRAALHGLLPPLSRRHSHQPAASTAN